MQQLNAIVYFFLIYAEIVILKKKESNSFHAIFPI
jgi:hypothetical protein